MKNVTALRLRMLSPPPSGHHATRRNLRKIYTELCRILGMVWLRDTRTAGAIACGDATKGAPDP